ncbi:MAG: hypothetical protein PUJ12_08085, partial [Oscillospiraceae bacterium]|nr:hypothetical protein [Oscillospiraceae bacterium]
AACPITPALRQKILGGFPFPSALSGPFAAPLFAPLSALRDSLWMRWQLYFRFNGLSYVMLFIHQTCPFVKHFFPPQADFIQPLKGLNLKTNNWNL